MKKLHRAALVVGLITVALWAAITLTGCPGGVAPSGALGTWRGYREAICGALGILEEQAADFLEAAEEKERRAREEAESSSEEEASAEDDSEAVEPVPPTVPAPPEPTDG